MEKGKINSRVIETLNEGQDDRDDRRKHREKKRQRRTNQFV